MATVRMKKGDKYADVFDSPETIRQAQLDGYSLVEKKAEKTEKTIEVSEEAPKATEETKSRNKR